VLRATSKTPIAANEAITRRPSGMAICFSIDPQKSPLPWACSITNEAETVIFGATDAPLQGPELDKILISPISNGHGRYRAGKGLGDQAV
jgi:hypothetical protein